MEIDPAIYNQYRDTPFKPEDLKNNQINIKLGKKIQNPNMDEYINYVNENIREKEPFKEKGKSYNIILTTSLDKTKNTSQINNSSLNNDINNEANIDTAKSYSKNDITLSLKFLKKYNTEIVKNNVDEKRNKDFNNRINDETMRNKEEMDNKKNMDMIVDDRYYENNFGGENYKNNYYSDNKIEEYNKKNIYNPFSKKENEKNFIQESQNEMNNTVPNKTVNKKGKLPNITLTAFIPPPKNKNEKEGKFTQFINLFSSRKRKKKENDESKPEEIQNEENNQLQTLEQKLEQDNVIIVDNKKEEKLSNNNKYDFVMGKIPSKKEKINNSKDIEKLKCELSGNEDLNDSENKEQNTNNNDNTKCFMVQAEPILNSDNKNSILNSSEKENNLGDSFQMVDIDNSSEFTLRTGTNIDELIRKKSKVSPLLIGILLGSCALFYLLYKKIRFKEIYSKVAELFKQIPEYLNYIISYIGSCLGDFMERYGDISRLLVGIVFIITFWFLFKFFMKLIMKRRKNKK